MQRSTDRILTTHAGSLPMPADLHAMLRAREAGQPYDAPALQTRLTRAVAEVVHQPAAPDHRAPEVADAGGRRAPGFAEALEPLRNIRVRLCY